MIIVIVMITITGGHKSGHDHSKVSNPAYEPVNPLQVISWMCQAARKYSTMAIPGVYGSSYDKFPLGQLFTHELQIMSKCYLSDDNTWVGQVIYVVGQILKMMVAENIGSGGGEERKLLLSDGKIGKQLPSLGQARVKERNIVSVKAKKSQPQFIYNRVYVSMQPGKCLNTI